MKKNKGMLLILLSIVFLAFVVTGCGAEKQKDSSGMTKTKEPEKVVAKFSHVVTEDSPKGSAALKFAELVKQKSNGRMEIKVYPNSQLYGDKDELENLKANNVQFIAPSAAKLVGIDPRFQIADLPFLLGSFEANRRFFEGEGGQKLNEKLAEQNIVCLAWWNNSFRHFTDKHTIIRKPEDMKGKKYRISAGGVATDIFASLGASGVQIPVSDLYTALQRGVVDGTFASINNIETEKQQEVVKYLTLAYVNTINYPVLVNKKFWDGLPDDLKKVVREAMAEATDFEWKMSEQYDKVSLEKLKKEGMQVHELTPEERAVFQKALEPVYQKYEAKITKELIELAKKVDKEVSKGH